MLQSLTLTKNCHRFYQIRNCSDEGTTDGEKMTEINQSNDIKEEYALVKFSARKCAVLRVVVLITLLFFGMEIRHKR